MKDLGEYTCKCGTKLGRWTADCTWCGRPRNSCEQLDCGRNARGNLYYKCKLGGPCEVKGDKEKCEREVKAEEHFCWGCRYNSMTWGVIPCEYGFTREYKECPGYREASWFRP